MFSIALSMASIAQRFSLRVSPRPRLRLLLVCDRDPDAVAAGARALLRAGGHHAARSRTVRGGVVLELPARAAHLQARLGTLEGVSAVHWTELDAQR